MFLSNPRRHVGTAVASTVALGLATVAAAETANSTAGGSRTILGNDRVRIERSPSGMLVAESTRSGRRTRLANEGAVRALDLDGNFVGLARAGRPGQHGLDVVSIDARSGKVFQRTTTESVLALEVRRTGSLAWMSEAGGVRAVHVRNAGGEHTVASGRTIEPQSLALADSDATVARLYWTDAGKPAATAIE
jgi:hypothetical protein